MKLAQNLIIYLLICSVDASIPQRKWFRQGSHRSSQSNMEDEEYDYDEEEDDNERNERSRSSIKGIQLSHVFAGASCLSVIGCGIYYRLKNSLKKNHRQPFSNKRTRWFNKNSKSNYKMKQKQQNRINENKNNDDEGSLDSELTSSSSSNIDEENQIKKNNIEKVPSLNESSEMSPNKVNKKQESTEKNNNIQKKDMDRDGKINIENDIENDVNFTQEEEIRVKKGGIISVLGPNLLKISKNGTRLESIETEKILKGKIVALYFSSLTAEIELKTNNITRSLLSHHIEMVRQMLVLKGYPLEMIYVSLDENARSFRDMVSYI